MLKPILVLSILAASPVLAQTSRPEVEDVEEVRIHTGGVGEYKTLFELSGLTDDQRKAAEQKLEARNASLRAFNESEDGKRLVALRTELAAARRNKETAKITPLRQQIQPLADAYLELRNKGRVEILSVLTPEQLAQYASRAIRARSLRGLESVAWTPEQNGKIDQICLDAANKHFAGNTLADDPFFHKTEPLATEIHRRVVKEVLTDAQREALKKPASVPAAVQ